MIENLHKVIDDIIKATFAPEDRRLQNWVDRLCDKNQEARGGGVEYQMGFLYGGVYYRNSRAEGQMPAKRAIDPSLFDQAEMFVKDRSQVDRDKAFIRQGLFSILNPCHSLQDMRDTLPECIATSIPQLAQLPRRYEEAFTIADDPRAMRQFNKILPKLEVYATSKLIY